MNILPIIATIAAAMASHTHAQQSQAQTQDKSPAAQSSSGTAAAKVRGPVVALDTVTMKGEVTSIDPVRRQIMVKGSDGSTATVVAGPEVNNFDNLKVGDEVTMRYMQAQSLAIAKGSGDASKVGEIRTKVEAEAARQAPPGGKPGVSAMERTTMVANVFDIDRERGILTLRGTSGVPVKVRMKDKEALQSISKDDQVVIAYREAMAVSIQPGPDAGMPPTGAGKTKQQPGSEKR